MIVFKELKKIVRQIRGKEHLFGYRSTAANQLYLLFCFCGNIYFTDKIHKHVKWLWLSMASWYILLTYYTGLMYILHSDKRSVMKSLYVLSLQILANAMQFGLPLMCYWCRNNIEDTITQVDKISQYRSSYNGAEARTVSKLINAKRMILSNVSIILVTNFVRLFVSVFDVIVFYDEAKLNNSFYYIFFLPKNQNVSGLGEFLIINVIFDLTFVFVITQWISLLSFMLLWTIICHNHLIMVCHQMTEAMNEIIGYVERIYKPSRTWNRAFRRNLVWAIRKYQKIIRWVDTFFIKNQIMVYN